jgi:hypothetical protein
MLPMSPAIRADVFNTEYFRMESRAGWYAENAPDARPDGASGSGYGLHQGELDREGFGRPAGDKKV